MADLAGLVVVGPDVSGHQLLDLVEGLLLDDCGPGRREGPVLQSLWKPSLVLATALLPDFLYPKVREVREQPTGPGVTEEAGCVVLNRPGFSGGSNA